MSLIEKEIPDSNRLNESILKKSGWKNPPNIDDLKQNLNDALSSHTDHIEQVEYWSDYYNAKGQAAVKTPKNRSRIVPKLIRKHAEWRIPSLTEPFLSAEDMFMVSPVTAEDRDAAKQNQLVINHQFNTKLNKVKFIDDFVRTAVEEGTTVVKVGWKYEEKKVKKDVPRFDLVPDPSFEQVLQEVMMIQEETPSLYITDVPDELKEALEISMETGVAHRPEILGYEEQDVIETINNHPTVEICNFKDIIIDPTANGDIEKASFVIHRFDSSLSELKKDGRYDNLDKLHSNEPDRIAKPDEHYIEEKTNTFSFRDNPRKKLTVYEYWGFWDINDSGIVEPFVASWVGNTLIRLEENPFPDSKLPFVITQYLPRRNHNYGEPDGALLVDNQKIVGAVTRGMIDILARSANGQRATRKDFLDITNRRRFENGQDYEFNPGVRPEEGLYLHKYDDIPQAAQFMMMSQQAEAESITGIKAFNAGMTSESLGRVATGIRGALDAASKREVTILRRLAKGIVDIGRKFISMNAEFLSDEEVIRITDEEFVTVRKDDLAGDFDLKLNITTAEEDNAKAEELAYMMQTLGNNIPFEITKMIMGDIANLRKMPDLARRIERYEPEPDPIQERLQQLQVELLEAQLRNLESQSIERQTRAQLNAAKAATEGYRGENIQADTDKKNLDFVEQESGVKQEREKELRGEQARSQERLKMLESEERQLDRDYNMVSEWIKNRGNFTGFLKDDE